MSEGIIIALITAVGSLLGGIIGQFITASATINAARIKEKVNPPSSSNSEKPRSWVGIIIGAIIGAIATLIVFALLGMFPPKTENPPKASTTNEAILNTTINTPASPSLKLGKILFQEDFNGNSNQWPTGTDKGDTFYIDAGEYHVIGGENNKYGGWLAPSKRSEQNLGDFYIETKARFIEGTQQDDTYGILFRYSNNSGPYIFMIGNAQQVYSLHTDKPIIGWTYSPRIVKDGTNIIGILCEGNTITIYINGSKVDSVESNYSSSGGIGLDYASNQHTAFDYFYVWELSR